MSEARNWYLYVRWYAMPNDVIGGWCVMPVEQPPSAGMPEVSDFVSEVIARHITDLHNDWLDSRVHGFVNARELDGQKVVYTGHCLLCNGPEGALQHPPANAKKPPAAPTGEAAGGTCSR